MRDRIQRFLARLALLREYRALPFVAFLALVFFALSVTVHLPGMLAFDHGITRSIQSVRSPSLDRAAAAFTFMGNTTTLLALGFAALVAFAVSRKPRTGFLFAALILVIPLNEGVKRMVGRARPSGDLVDIIAPAVGLSFPSGHASGSVAFYGFLALLSWIHIQRRSARNLFVTAFIMIAAGVALSRVYLGVHWFSDVMGGMTAGVIILFIMAEVYKAVGIRELAPSPSAEPQAEAATRS